MHAIDKLPVFRLNAMLEHIRLGNQNLKKTLPAHQYDEFLQFIASYENHHENAFLICLERVGNMTLVANTVTSSTFGSWLAISGAMGFGSVSLQALFLAIGISFSLSLWGALSSYRVLKHEADEKLMNQRLLYFQAKILKEIDKKKFFEIMKA
ncbi:MAG TPA: hypothetical protein VD770_03585, partial [Coxiellaceae bacterium]|nr:hypothetical protein [Coxiellaceae bacterium]